MKLSFIVHSINLWFARVVYERDGWDEWLTDLTDDDDNHSLVLLIALLSRFFIFVTRMILWLLMMIGHGISCVLARQMEYDADRYEANITGSAEFERSMRRLTELGFGDAIGIKRLGELWQAGGLPDNHPRFVAAITDHLPDEAVAKIRELVDVSKTGMFDSHPASKDRIEAANKLEAERIFTIDRPATHLFTDFDKLARSGTRSMYKRLFRKAFNKEMLVPVSDTVDAV